MTTTAIAVLQTPWDCKWSRFGQVHRASSTVLDESLWVCDYQGAHPIAAAECEGCPHWEYAPPHDATAASACASSVTQRLETGVRVTAFALAVLLAAIGVVVLTRPLAIPLTISLWIGAIASFLLSVWGRFDPRALPPQSW